MPEQRVAIVTGASGGIGYATAKRLAAAGYRVYGLSRHPREEVWMHGLAADVCDAQAVESLVAQVYAAEGRIDLLVSNAGFGISGPVEDTLPADAKRQIDVNFFGFFHCARAVIPYMRAQGGGCITAVSSVAGTIPIPFRASLQRVKRGRPSRTPPMPACWNAPSRAWNGTNRAA